jgi:DNA recombination protein RmuC
MSNSQVRGQWGEMQLERILEYAGLVENVHYTLQTNTNDGSGRPDCVLQLPNGGRIVIDSKFPLVDFMAAQQESDPARSEEMLRAHAKSLLEHCKILAKRDYTKDADTVEFVLAFLPVEVLLSSALTTQPTLLEEIYKLNVGVATPVTLMPLLKTLHHTWQKHEFAKNALKIQDEGGKMLDRLVRLGALMTKVGSGLKTTVGAFNDMVGSFDGRVVPAAREMRTLGLTAASDMAEVGPVDQQVREVRSPQVLEFPAPTDSEDGSAAHNQG